jgi:hypothetical protein
VTRRTLRGGIADRRERSSSTSSPQARSPASSSSSQGRSALGDWRGRVQAFDLGVASTPLFSLAGFQALFR